LSYQGVLLFDSSGELRSIAVPMGYRADTH